MELNNVIGEFRSLDLLINYSKGIAIQSIRKRLYQEVRSL